MPWVEVFAVFLASHLMGDFLLQTDWQATHKQCGLRQGELLARRALLSHIATYTVAFVPALIWLADDIGAGILGIAALIAGPHLIQDDGRLLAAYARAVKNMEPSPGVTLMAVDQSFHVLALFAVSLIAGS
jgi:hypothetical protein